MRRQIGDFPLAPQINTPMVVKVWGRGVPAGTVPSAPSVNSTQHAASMGGAWPLSLRAAKAPEVPGILAKQRYYASPTSRNFAGFLQIQTIMPI
jgi:hypothetical protein